LQGQVREFLDNEEIFSRRIAIGDAVESTAAEEDGAATAEEVAQGSIIRIIAPGGAGKTLAALAAFEQALEALNTVNASGTVNENVPGLVYLAPTQELCDQMQADIQILMSKMNIHASKVNIKCLTYDAYNANYINKGKVDTNNISASLINQFKQYITNNKAKFKGIDLDQLKKDLKVEEFYLECSNSLVWPNIEKVGRNTLITADSDEERKEKLREIKEFASAYSSYIQNTQTVLKDPNFITLSLPISLAINDIMLVVCDESQTQSAHAIKGIATSACKQNTVVMVLSDPNQALEPRLALSPFNTIGLEGEKLLVCNNTNRCSASAARLATAIIDVKNKEFRLRASSPIKVECAVEGKVYKSKNSDYTQYYNHHDLDTYLIVFDEKIREDLKKNGALLVFSPEDALGLERKRIVIITTRAQITNISEFNRLYVAVTRSQEDVIIVDDNYDKFANIFSKYGENLAEFDATARPESDLSTYSGLKLVIDLFAESRNAQAEEILNFLYNRAKTERGGKTKQELQVAKAKIAAITEITRGTNAPEGKLREVLRKYDSDFTDSEFVEFYSDCLDNTRKDIVLGLGSLTEDAPPRAKRLAQEFMVDGYFNSGRFSFDEITPIMPQSDYTYHKTLLSKLLAKTTDDVGGKARLSLYKKHLFEKFKDQIFADIAEELRLAKLKPVSSAPKGKQQTTKSKAHPEGEHADSENLNLLLAIVLEDQKHVIESIFATKKNIKPLLARKLFPLMFETIYQNYEKYNADQIKLIKDSISDEVDRFLIAYKEGKIVSISDNFIDFSPEQRRRVGAILGENNIYEDFAKFNASKTKNNGISDYITYLLMTNGNPEFAKILLDGTNALLISSDFEELKGLQGMAVSAEIFILAVGKSYPHIMNVLLTTTNARVKVDINAIVYGDDNTTLMLAAIDNKIEIVEALLAVENIKVNMPDNNGNTALMIAAQNGHIEVVKALLAVDDIKVNVQDNEKNTALILAANNGHIEVVKALLAVDDIKVNMQDNEGNTALILAANNGHIEVVKALLAVDDIKVNVKDIKGFNALMSAAINNKVEIVKALLRHPDIDVKMHGNKDATALIMATDKGHIEVVKALLKHRDIKVNALNENGSTALMVAANRGYTDIVEVLLKVPEIDVNVQTAKGFNALMIAADKGHEEVTKLILAVDNEDTEIVDLKAKNKEGNALMIAANRGFTNIVEALLLKIPRIDINARNDSGYTALMYAVRKGHIKTVEALLKVPEIDVNAQNDSDVTALMYAVSKGHIKVIEALLRAPNIEINKQDKECYTALSIAAEEGNAEAVSILLTHSKIDVNVQNENGATALNIAEDRGYLGVASALHAFIVKSEPEDKGTVALPEQEPPNDQDMQYPQLSTAGFIRSKVS
jgi:ankyrin repeat protein